jgi:hypothetical protein
MFKERSSGKQSNHLIEEEDYVKLLGQRDLDPLKEKIGETHHVLLRKDSHGTHE